MDAAMKKEMDRGVDKKKNRRGSAKNQSRLDHFTNRRKGSSASWESCDADRLHHVVTTITDLGGAITLGLARDKGAHFLTLLLDEDKATMWYNGDANLDDALDDVVAGLEVMD